MSEKHNLAGFDPNGVGLKNGNFLGLPFNEQNAGVVLLPVPWDLTVSYGEGTALAPEAILNASTQLDLYDLDAKDAWEKGIFFQPVNQEMLNFRNELRPLAAEYIDFLENGGNVEQNIQMKDSLAKINEKCVWMNSFVYNESKKLLNAGKIVGLIGGDHSSPLGYLKALSEKYTEFGVLQIDAHMDLRNAYEGFTFSHASIFNNALQLSEITKLVQVGIRDFCEEEVSLARNSERIHVFFDQQLKEEQYKGRLWNEQVDEIIGNLPGNVYVSFDVDGLDPKLCSGTGTPVPGGLEFSQAVFVFKKIVESGRKLVGFDVCESGHQEWDANVAARLTYKLSCLVG